MKRRHRILIVDDDADDREMVKDAFEQVVKDQDYILLENGDRLLEHLHGRKSSVVRRQSSVCILAKIYRLGFSKTLLGWCLLLV